MKAAALLIFLTSAVVHAQQSGFAGARDSLTLTITPADTLIALHRQFIVRGSEEVFVDSTRLPPEAYTIDARYGALHIADTRFLPADPRHPRRLKIVFSYLPFSFKNLYAHRVLTVQHDSLFGTEQVATPAQEQALTMENIFGPNFQKSGTLIRGLSIGTNQDATVTSGFHMQFSGTVTKDIGVVGVLTDENTPIQPEGNTATIQELDKVFVGITSPNVSGTFGDFDAAIGGSEFADVARKVEGGQAYGHSGLGSAQIVAATTRGKYNTQQFSGSDGVQGPYLLTGANGENDIIVIAGTEHVYVDGVAQQRGENLDYVIDYSAAQITFQARRLITSASRITVDFQYSDQQYARSLLAAQAAAPFGGDSALTIAATYMREGDNQDAPLSITLGDSAKRLLAQAGGDRTKASYSGVQLAPVDSVTHLPKGYYIRRDTLINGKPDSVFIYAPGDSNAFYTVAFTYVGAGNGAYSRIAALQYQFVGEGQGSYAPVVYLPLPTLAQVADARVRMALGGALAATTEFAYSDYSLNRFSTLPDAHWSGTAGGFTLQLLPQNVGVGASHFGRISAGAHVRSLSPLFHPIDRINPIEFNRDWNLPAAAERQKQNLYEGNVAYSPVEQITLNASAGELQSGRAFATARQQYSVNAADFHSFSATYSLDVLNSRGLPGIGSSNWTRQNGGANYTLGMFTPGVQYTAETKQEYAHGVDSLGNPVYAAGAMGDTLDPSSYDYTMIQPRLRIAPSARVAFYGSYDYRTDDSVRAGAFARQSVSHGGGGGFELHDLAGVNATGDITIVNKTIEPAFYATSGTNNQSLAMRVQAGMREWNGFLTGDLYYQAAAQRAAKLERRFVLVPIGTGQYVYLGDLNHNGVQDENEFSLTAFGDGNYTLVYAPTDQLYPVANLNVSERIRLAPRSLFAKPAGALQTILAALSSETYTRIEEHSTTPDVKDIYFLHLSQFLNGAYTLNGAQQFQQDFYVLENDPDFSLRLRYSQNKGLSQYATTTESSYRSEQSLRIRWHLVEEIGSELNIGRTRDELAASGLSVNTPRRLSTNLFSSDLSYRPIPEIEAGWRLDLRTTTDTYATPDVVANKDFNNFHLTYSFAGKGTLRGEVERDEVALSVLPQGYTSSFQLTDGFEGGKTYIARATFEYRITANVQASATYTGRLHTQSLPVHTFQAEVRALF